MNPMATKNQAGAAKNEIQRHRNPAAKNEIQRQRSSAAENEIQRHRSLAASQKSSRRKMQRQREVVLPTIGGRKVTRRRRTSDTRGGFLAIRNTPL